MKKLLEIDPNNIAQFQEFQMRERQRFGQISNISESQQKYSQNNNINRGNTGNNNNLSSHHQHANVSQLSLSPMFATSDNGTSINSIQSPVYNAYNMLFC